MKVYIVILLAVIVAATADKPYYNLADAPQLFEKYIKDYDKHYKDEQDKLSHYEAFKENLAVINEANAMQDSATFDINHMADYTKEERRMLTGLILPKPGSEYDPVAA